MDVLSITHQLYPDIETYEKGMLALGDHHKMYWEVSGNPKGVPIIFLHGGPGAGSSPVHRRFFDPNHYKIIIFDQRGSGKSEPFADIKNNTTQHLIADIELLRHHLEIDSWLIFGGSWGSSLALAYGISHPNRVRGLIIRGIFLCTQKELKWFFHGIRRIFPEYWNKFQGYLPEDEREDILNNYHKRLIDPDRKVHEPAARVWCWFEGACATLLPNSRVRDDLETGYFSLALARIESHYFMNNFFLPKDYFSLNLNKICHIPAIIVQGRYDMICPISTAYDLATYYPKAELVIVPDAGHSAMEPSVLSALVAATEKFKVY